MTPEYKVTVPFQQEHDSFGTVMVKNNKKARVFCAETMCKKSFDSVDEMLHHLDFEEHDFVSTQLVTQLARVADKWVARFTVDNATENSSACSDQDVTESAVVSELEMGLAIPKRSNRSFKEVQTNLLDRWFDQGETTGVKSSAV